MASEFPGMGVMIGMLGGNEETVEAYKGALNKVIESAKLESDILTIRFSDGTGISVRDEGQSCCESRYMTTDDDLSGISGATLLDMEIAPADNIPDKYGEHEVQFLRVKTSKGTVTLATHNEHNGYYGGFWIVIRKA